MAEELVSDYECAARVAATLATLPGLSAVLLGGVGDDWTQTPVYPYAVVSPESADNARGTITRTIRARLVVRASDGASKPEKTDESAAAPVFSVGAGAALDALVTAARDALAIAKLGAPVESISTEYDAETSFPVQSAILSVSLADVQGYGDSF